ncbi:lysosomal membrane ascorbate-dependent ferrireductase CYB561A3 isoform X2 [Protopterus annectens]|nr:lysosomal membrane ascorbate-dependent ferrireductase CYB561A3 isoform X2 [Protopterus annectens]
MAKMRPAARFYLLYSWSLLLGFICVLSVVYWSYKWHGGFAWDGTLQHFNWHPVLMVTSLVILYGNAIIIYRIPSSQSGSKLPWKILHAGVTLVALLMSVVGLVAVFMFHAQSKIPHLYSLHSWVGLSAVILFACQWLSGFMSFLLPFAPPWFRRLYKPIHVYYGMAIFILSLAASFIGINEKLIFSLNGKNSTSYSLLPPEGQFANVLGMLLMGFGFTVMWILNSVQRQPSVPEHTEDRQPLLEGDD